MTAHFSCKNLNTRGHRPRLQGKGEERSDQNRYETLIPAIQYLKPAREAASKFPPSPFTSMVSGRTGVNPTLADPPKTQLLLGYALRTKFCFPPKTSTYVEIFFFSTENEVNARCDT